MSALNIITGLLRDQSPEVLGLVERLVRRIVERRREVDLDVLEREIERVFPETGEAFVRASERLHERFPEGEGEP